MGYELPFYSVGCYPADVDMTLAQFQPVFLEPAAVTTGYGQGGAAVTLNTALAFTGNTTSGNAVVANANPVAGLGVGQTVTGAGIPANTTILSISGTNVTLSANATATATGVALSAAYANASSKIPLGIAQNPARLHEAVDVMVTGISKAKAVGSLAIGDPVMATAGGVTKATTGNFAFARACEVAVSGDITSILLMPLGVQ